MKELQPCHIQLGRSGAAPLTCFQQDKTDRQACLALLFKSRNQYALWIAKPEQYVRACILVVNPHKGRGPKWEIVSIAQTYKFLGYLVMVGVIRLNVENIGEEAVDRACLNKFADERDTHHLNRQPLDRHDKVGDRNLNSFSNRPLSSNRVERRIHHLIPAVVLRQYLFYIGQTVCHTNHS